jgi:hypothetical protein
VPFAVGGLPVERMMGIRFASRDFKKVLPLAHIEKFSFLITIAFRSQKGVKKVQTSEEQNSNGKRKEKEKEKSMLWDPPIM